MIEKERAKTAEKQVSMSRKVASMIISKATSVVASIGDLQNKDEFELIATPLKERLVAKRDFLTDVLSKATTVADHTIDPKTCPKLPDMKLVVDAVADVKKQMAVINNMFAAIARSR